MLIGDPTHDTVFEGKAPAFFAHIARPFKNSKGGKREGTRGSVAITYKEKSFCVGDILQPVDKGPERAAIVRVIYKPKEGTGKKGDQVRRLLLLMETFDNSESVPESMDETLFAASWPNWERAPLNKRGWGKGKDPSAPGSERLALSFEQAQVIENVRHAPMSVQCSTRTYE